MADRNRAQPGAPDFSDSGEAGWPSWVDPLAAQSLRDAIRDNRVGHAYLISGPSGVGKAAVARAVAQSLCCTDADPDDASRPCSACRACRNVARGVHPDVEWFDLESQARFSDKPSGQGSLSIETVRRLRNSAALFPLESERRIIVVDDAETLLEPAQQAFLKTLEEPPPTVTIILLSDDADALLDTVRSRCQEVRVRPAPDAVIARALAARGIDDGVAADVVSFSRGAAAWALAASSDTTLLQERRAEHAAAADWLAAGSYERLVTAFKLGEQFGKRRGYVLGIVLAATDALRTRMIGAADGASGEPREASALALGRAVDASLRCLADLDANVRPRLALEAMVMRWPRLEPIPD